MAMTGATRVPVLTWRIGATLVWPTRGMVTWEPPDPSGIPEYTMGREPGGWSARCANAAPGGVSHIIGTPPSSIAGVGTFWVESVMWKGV